MHSTLSRWQTIAKIPTSSWVYFIGLTFVEIICYIFLPISYANIASAVTSQNNQLATLWAVTNFMTQVLSIISSSSKTRFLNRTHNYIITNLNQKVTANNKEYIEPTFKDISEYIFTLNSFLVLTLKLSAIIIVAGVYSLFLMVYILIAILLCLLISALLQKRQNKKTNSTLNSSVIIDCIWTIFTFVITLVIIDLINEQKITLTIFLLLSTFINTHLIKPNFDLSFIYKTKRLSSTLDTYFKFSKLK